MPRFRITVKQPTNTNGVRLERGMTVEIITQSMINPITTNMGQTVVDAFLRIYNVDLRKAGALNMVYLECERIG